MKKVKYERPQINIVDYELDQNFAEDAAVSVQATGFQVELEAQQVTFP